MSGTVNQGSGDQRPGNRAAGRWLRVELEAGAARVSAIDLSAEPTASYGGSGAALALVAQELRQRADMPVLALGVGSGVVRGLPTAARVAVAGRSPLSGRYTEGQVGGDFALHLAQVADGLVLVGRASGAGLVLLFEADGSARLVSRPALAPGTPAEIGAALEVEFAPAASIVIGPAGRSGVLFASLASGGASPSFVGRGGLGAVFGSTGLIGIAIREASDKQVEAVDARAPALARHLLQSPRLAERAEGGTLELLRSFELRGDVTGGDVAGGDVERGDATGGDPERAPRDAPSMTSDGRHGCRGCPTPCGLDFSTRDASVRPRFGATDALGSRLGLEHLEDTFELLAACDAAGLDAKEMGAALEWFERAVALGRCDEPSARGDLEALIERIELTARRAGVGELLSQGAAAVARRFGLEAEAPLIANQAARPVSDLAGLLGQCTSSAGSDPMRSFPFLLESGIERLRELAPELELSARAADPLDPTAKGALCFWHENLIAAVDAIGFCAFSTAGLLGDAVLSLDELARAIAPAAMLQLAPAEPGRALLAAGASIVLERRRLDVQLVTPAFEVPRFAAESLAQVGMLDDYLASRGLDSAGVPTAAALARVGTLAAAQPVARAVPAARAEPLRVDPVTKRVEASAAGRVTLFAAGQLGRALGGELVLNLGLPASVGSVLDAARRQCPNVHFGRPAVWCDGRRVALDDEVDNGARLELVLAIAGG